MSPNANDRAPRASVLVVDDEPAVRRLASRVIQSCGFDVVEAADGEEAIAKFSDRCAAFACVLLDLSMPKLSGAETFAALRRLAPQIPIVLTSGYDDADSLPGLRATDRCTFLQKPFGPDDLTRCIHAAVAP